MNESSTLIEATQAAPGEAKGMSLNDTINLIYAQPGRVFEALRERPRFLAAALIVLATSTVYTVILVITFGYENLMRAVILGNANLAPEVQEQMTSPGQLRGMLVTQLVSMLIGFVLTFAVGGGLYRLGVKVAGGVATYSQTLAVWTYSSLPPLVISSLLNVALLFLKPPDVATAAHTFRYGGLAQMYFSRALVDAAAHPVLAALLQAVEPFSLYGLFLAALGLHKVARLSSGQAWAVVLTFFCIRALLSVSMATLLQS